MKIKHLVIALSALALTSCTSMLKTSSTASINARICQYPTVTDLIVSPTRVEKTVEWDYNPFDRTSDQVRKDNLMADIIKENNADVLVEPQVKIEKEIFGTCSITISGYPASFQGFRKATEADIEALKANNPRLYNCVKPDPADCDDFNACQPKKHKKKGFPFFK